MHDIIEVENSWCSGAADMNCTLAFCIAFFQSGSLGPPHPASLPRYLGHEKNLADFVSWPFGKKRKLCLTLLPEASSNPK